MSIRYECDECGSVFKIKDSLAGTKGKCPNCQKKFIVPQKGPDSGIDLESSRDSKIEKQDRSPDGEAPFAPHSSSGQNGTSLSGAAPKQESPSSKKITPKPEPTQPAPAASKSSPSLPPATAQPAPDTAAAPPVPSTAEPVAAAGDAGDAERGNDFDVDSFLMDEEAAAQAKASAGLTTPTAAATSQPQYDKQGRRILGTALARPGSPSASPAASAAASVADAALEGGQVKAGPLQLEPRRRLIPFTAAGSLKLLRRRAPWIVLGAALIAGTFFLSNRLLAVQLNKPLLFDVTGTVTLDGKPLSGVVVHLTPVFAQEGKDTRDRPMRLRDSIGVTDDNGLYSVQYMDGVPGAPPGNARIWVETLLPVHLKTIPAGYLSNASTDIRSVKEAGNERRFNLDLKSQPQQ